MIEHDRRSAVLEGSGRHLRFELEMDLCPPPLAPDEGRPSLAERDPRGTREPERRRVAPERGVRRDNRAAGEAPAGSQIEMAAAIAPPKRPVSPVNAPATGAMKARDRHRPKRLVVELNGLPHSR